MVLYALPTKAAANSRIGASLREVRLGKVATTNFP